MLRTAEEWIGQYKAKDALWIHDGNKKRPHALLTSGKHSNGFFNSRLVIPDEALLRDAAADLVEIFTEQGGDLLKVRCVVGPATGATKLAELISKVVGNTRGLCSWASPEKKEIDGKKSMVFSGGDLGILSARYTLLCEDVLTTGGSVDLTSTAIKDMGGFVLPFILVLVNRSGLKEVSGKKIIALIDRDMPMWTPEECPLCKEGSEAIKPKDTENWQRLNATY